MSQRPAHERLSAGSFTAAQGAPATAGRPDTLVGQPDVGWAYSLTARASHRCRSTRVRKHTLQLFERALRLKPIAFLLLNLLIAGCAARQISVNPARIVDLSYSFGPQTIYWPTAQPFELRRVAYGRTPQGYFYA